MGIPPIAGWFIENPSPFLETLGGQGPVALRRSVATICVLWKPEAGRRWTALDGGRGTEVAVVFFCCEMMALTWVEPWVSHAKCCLYGGFYGGFFHASTIRNGGFPMFFGPWWFHQNWWFPPRLLHRGSQQEQCSSCHIGPMPIVFVGSCCWYVVNKYIDCNQ